VAFDSGGVSPYVSDPSFIVFSAIIVKKRSYETATDPFYAIQMAQQESQYSETVLVPVKIEPFPNMQ
jgi:hypothetical protein